MNRPAKKRPAAASDGVVRIEIDGAARGNPGPAGAGIVLKDPSGKILLEHSVYLGASTNNVAETCALILALQEALKRSIRKVSVFSDSLLLTNQVGGSFRVKDERLQWLHAIIRNLLESFEQFEMKHLPRAQNRAADRLANRAVDQGLKGQATFML